MKKLLQTEQLAQLSICIFAIYMLPIHLTWWAYLLLFFAPDLSIAGYAVNTRIGAWLYNLAHHKMIAAALMIVGAMASQHYLVLAGLIMYAHSSFDRMLGYGLKHEDSFQNTHLGWIGKGK